MRRRSATDAFLKGCEIAGALHRDLCGGGVDRAEVVWREHDLGRAKALDDERSRTLIALSMRNVDVLLLTTALGRLLGRGMTVYGR